MRIAVLAGGSSAERQVSLNSAVCVVRALRDGGHQVTVLDPGDRWLPVDPAAAPAEAPASSGLPGEEGLAELKAAEVVFNTLHGGRGEDGTLNAVLELVGVPYIGGRPGACAAAMNKVVSKRLFSTAGVPTPEYEVLSGARKELWPAQLDKALGWFDLPLIVKPAEEGSTVGLSKVQKREELYPAVEKAAGLSRQVLIERFIEGRELTVGILAGKALPVLEVVVPSGFYDYQAKYLSHENRYICPAEIDEDTARRAQGYAEAAFEVLGLEDYARIDFRLDHKGGLWCLEANNQPGMTDSSLLPKAARVTGLDLTALLERIIKNALSRY
ncbi:MAG TPA: D-alanine--D-alanine ligase [Candidatus Glassbacteria bacterium]|nr:D-alanine--D-alanine ligase [Candidatus Glassbacteria bacterium]